MGKVKIAETLARAGLHLGATTVGRMLKQPRKTSKSTSAKSQNKSTEGRIVTAKRINHVWHIDLTIVPTGVSLWCSWLPWALPQCWPFCYWVAIAIDHFSRRAVGVASFKQQPISLAVRSFLGRTIAKVKATPKYIICDRGSQFDNEDFRKWCKRKGIKKPRYGAVGKKVQLLSSSDLFSRSKQFSAACCLCRTDTTSFAKSFLPQSNGIMDVAHTLP